MSRILRSTCKYLASPKTTKHFWASVVSVCPLIYLSYRTVSQMAWFCSAKSNKYLVQNMRDGEIIRTDRVMDAMMSVDRGDFAVKKERAYLDSPQSIGWNATISAPHMHAYALESLQDAIHDGSHVLDVGSGSGYLTACLALLAGEQGRVVGIEHVDGLTKFASENVSKNHKYLLDSGRIQFVTGDGRKGYPSLAPYDAIHVGAASEQIPQPLLDQLANNGKMVIPIGGDGMYQQLMLVEKDSEGNVKKKKLMGVAYVPLTDLEEQVW